MARSDALLGRFAGDLSMVILLAPPDTLFPSVLPLELIAFGES